MKRFILASLLTLSTPVFAGPCVDAYTSLVPPQASAADRQLMVDTALPVCTCIDDKMKASGYDPSSSDIVSIKKGFLPLVLKRTMTRSMIYTWEREMFSRSLDHPMALDTYLANYMECMYYN